VSKFYLVTGGTGFLGSALVRRLVLQGNRVRVFDNNLRGHLGRLQDVSGDIEFCEGDIRNSEAVAGAVQGVDAVCHLAFVNGTEYFYSMPELVLEVGVKGMMNVVDACLKHSVGELVLASSSEVYHEPATVPTDETAPMCIPDPLNPRYSYAAGKLISEIVALNYGRTRFERVVVFRPHNVYGPDMGWEHVIPQFVSRMKQACTDPADPLRFPIQGNGKQTRAFVFVEDFIDALMLLLEKGEHLGIYHIGTMEEVSIEELALMVGEYFGRRVAVMPSEPVVGGTPRRCPDIHKISALGYLPKWSLRDGLRVTAKWYDDNQHRMPANDSRKEDPRWQLTNV
jgi:nucleoside-diphosphate-sugar epimerase